MLKKIFKALDVENGEEVIVILLILQSFFIGVFQITLMVSAEALFLKSFDGDMLGTAYMFSGAAGILLTAIYSGLQSKISFTKAIMINLVAIGGFTGAIWYGLTASDLNWFPFILLVLMGPLYILPIISFSGLVLRLFSIRQGKRLFGLVDSGAVFGIIIGGLTTQIVISAVGETKNLLVIGLAGIILAILTQIVISKFFFKDAQYEDKSDSDIVEDNSDESSYSLLFKDPYIRMMSIFVTGTMVAMFIIHTSFLVATKSIYPGDAEFAGFLGNFTAAMMILTFIIKTFVYSKLVKTYGLKVSFLILPGVVILFTLGAIIAGHVFGTDPADSSFMFFFLMLALSKLFAVALKEAFQNPSFKILYQSLDKKIRFGIQAKIDGVVNEIAASISGGILAVLGLISFIGLVHREYILAAVLVGCGWLTIKLYNEYQNSLKNSLDKLQSASSKQDTNMTLVELLKDNTTSPDASIAEISSFLQKKLTPLEYDKSTLSPPIPDAITLPNNADDLRVMAKNKSTEKRLLLAKSITQIGCKDKHLNAVVLNELLKDPIPKVRIEAIKAVTTQKVSELYHVIIDLLDSVTYRNTAFNAITEIGKDTVDLMELSFYKTGVSDDTKMLMVKAMGIIGGQNAIDHILNKTNYPNRNIVNLVYESLQRCDYQPNEAGIHKLTQEIDTLIGITAWNIAAKNILSKAKVSERIISAIIDEIQLNFDSIYTLLSLTYDAKSIGHIKESIENGSSESIGFAIELLDLFLAEDLKPKLFPLIEDISEEDKMAQLELYYAIEQDSAETTLVDLINKDYNFTSKWTKLCAMHELHDISEKAHQGVIANIFNPDRLIRESAAWITYQKDKTKFYNCLSRIDEKEKSRLTNLISGEDSSVKSILFSKLEFLRSLDAFENANNETLYEIARNLTTLEINADEKYELTNDSFTGFVANGTIDFQKDKSTAKYSPLEVFSNISTPIEETSTIKGITDALCYVITNTKLYELVSNEPNLLSVFYASMDKMKLKQNMS